MSRLRPARRARCGARIRRVLQLISRFLGWRKRSWLQNGCKFLSEKIARLREKIAGTGISSH
jgi:hypothetical protein